MCAHTHIPTLLYVYVCMHLHTYIHTPIYVYIYTHPNFSVSNLQRKDIHTQKYVNTICVRMIETNIAKIRFTVRRQLLREPMSTVAHHLIP